MSVERKHSGILANVFRQSCENCILRVQRNTLEWNFSENNISVHFFGLWAKFFGLVTINFRHCVDYSILSVQGIILTTKSFFFIKHAILELISDCGWCFIGLSSALLRQSCHTGALRVKLDVVGTKNSLKTFSNALFCRTVNGQMWASRQNCLCRFVKTAVHLSRGLFWGTYVVKFTILWTICDLELKIIETPSKFDGRVFKNCKCILGVHGNFLKKKLFYIVLQVYKCFRSLSEKFSAWYK